MAGIAPFLQSDFVLLGFALGLVPVVASRIGRKGGFAVCLSQKTSTGKTLCIRTAQSTIHAADETDLAVNFGDTVGFLLASLPAFGGNCMAFKDIKGDIQPNAMAKLRSLIFNISSAAVRQGLTSDPIPTPQFIVAFLSAEEPLSTMFARSRLPLEGGDVVRLIELEVPDGSLGGIFAGVTGSSASEWAASLEGFLHQQHGTVIPRLVHRLATADTDRLRATVETYERDFLDQLRHLPGYQQRAAKSFALISAVGRVAVRAKLLPLKEEAVRGSVARLFWHWAGAQNRRDDELQARWRRFFSLLDNEQAVPTISAGDPALPPNIGGFRRHDRGTSYIYLRRELLAEIFNGPELDSIAIPEFIRRGCLLAQRGSDLTVPVRQGGQTSRSRYYRLVESSLSIARTELLKLA